MKKKEAGTTSAGHLADLEHRLTVAVFFFGAGRDPRTITTEDVRAAEAFPGRRTREARQCFGPIGADPDHWRDAEREVRERLYRMEEQEVEAVYVAPCKRADRQTVRAIELAPQAFPLISDSAKERRREIFAEAAYPDRWPLYMELQATRAALELNQQAAFHMRRPGRGLAGGMAG